MAHIETWYRWRYFCEIRQRYLTTIYHCSEFEIRKTYPDATPVENTRLERLVYDSLEEAMEGTSTACLAKGRNE